MKLHQILKEKVTRKLAMYSLTILIIFSMIVVGIFIGLFYNYISNNEKLIDSQRNFLLKNIRNIASNIHISRQGRVFFNRVSIEKDNKNLLFGLNRFNIFNSSETNFLLLDKDRKILINNINGDKQFDYYNDLNYYERNKIDPAFNGNEIFFDNFSYFTNQTFMIVGVPIFNSEGEVTGILLVESIVSSTKRILLNGICLMILSLFIAFIFSYVLFIIFSYQFTKPLYKMRDHAFSLANGKYDVTNNILQDDEIGYLANTLNLLSVKLKEADRQKRKLQQMRSDFISNISHELRTPVTVMVGSLEALVDGVVKDDESVKEYHENMLSEAKFLSRLIGDLLEINRLQNLDFIIEKYQVFILDVINDVVRSLRKISYKKNISINVYNKEFTDTINGDYGRLKQMFTIILDNAIKFSEENSEVKIVLEHKCIKIRDFGSGIKSEDIPYIFDRFYKERSEKNKVGTGLGLSIAKNIAIRHNIELNVDSVYGEYTEFIFKY